MTNTPIQDQCNRLPASVKQWLTDNPGCVILPRTLSAEISAATQESPNNDPHGERTLSQQEIDFIRTKSCPAETEQQAHGYRFFDSVQPEP